MNGISSERDLPDERPVRETTFWPHFRLGFAKHGVPLACLLIAIGMVELFIRNECEPAHDGRSASYWLENPDGTTEGFMRSIEAFRKMGSNAVPFLVAQLVRRPSRFSKFCDDKLAERIWEYKLGHHLPAFLANARLPSAYRAQTKRQTAAFLLGEIGSEAQGAVPALMRVYLDEQDIWPNGKYQIYYALSQMKGTKPLEQFAPQFMKFLESKDLDLQKEGAEMLELVGPMANAAVPRLLELAQDSRAPSFAIAKALWSVNRQTNVVLQLLLANLQSTNSGARSVALEYLSKVGLAGCAEGAITRLLKDRDYGVRDQARRVLRGLRSPFFWTDLLLSNAMSPSLIARRLNETPDRIIADLNQLPQNLERTQYRLQIEPAHCLGCGFEFSKGSLTKPSHCPRCDSTEVSEPTVSILNSD